MLAAIATYANARGQCWPAQAAIARRLKIGERTVRRAVSSLIDLGYLRVRERYGAGGARLANIYTIVLQSEQGDLFGPEGVAAPCHTPRPNDARPPATAGRPPRPNDARPPATAGRAITRPRNYTNSAPPSGGDAHAPAGPPIGPTDRVIEGNDEGHRVPSAPMRAGGGTPTGDDRQRPRRATSRKTAARGTYLPTDFAPPDEDAIEFGFDLQEIPAIRRRFLDYYRDRAGERAKSRDWRSRWRLWLDEEVARRKAASRFGRGGASHRGGERQRGRGTRDDGRPMIPLDGLQAALAARREMRGHGIDPDAPDAAARLEAARQADAAGGVVIDMDGRRIDGPGRAVGGAGR